MHYFSSADMYPALFAATAAMLTAVLLVVTQRWHGHLSMDSTFGKQKFHVHPTPRVGGISVAVGVLVGYMLASREVRLLLGPLILAGIPAFAIGLLDDITKKVSVRTRLLITMACGVLGWLITGHSITYANTPGLNWLLTFSIFSVAFTAFAVGGVVNAINIIDGLNGLAAGAVIIILTAFSLMCLALNDSFLAYASLILAGAVVGFLVVNWPLGKIFLGDGGAYFLGFAIAWIAVLMMSRHPNLSAWAPLLVCGYPVLEVAFSVIRRLRREGCSPGQADGVHLHTLMYRRSARQLFPNVGRTLQNGFTSPFVWACISIPASWAVFFYDNTSLLILGFLISAVTYVAFYTRLSRFRWFFRRPYLGPKLQKRDKPT